VFDSKLYMESGTQRGWAGVKKMAVCETGAANPQASHQNFFPVDGATRRPSWECHWLHVWHLVALCMVS
jgi:hypothetical protein